MMDRKPNDPCIESRYLFILQKFLMHWYEQKQVSRKYSSEEVFQQFMKHYDWGMQFVGPNQSTQIDLQMKYDQQTDRLELYQIRDKAELRRLMARLSFGKWFVPPQNWEKNLLQGYLNKVEGMIKPDDSPIDMNT